MDNIAGRSWKKKSNSMNFSILLKYLSLPFYNK